MSLKLPPFPFVLKTTDEHEGQGVFLIEDLSAWQKALSYLKARERDGRFGFLLQQYLPSPYDLRILVIWAKYLAFWRKKEGFKGNLVQTGQLVPTPDKTLEEKAVFLTQKLLSKTGLNLCAIDFLITEKGVFFDEINYVFGRRAIKDFDLLFFEALKGYLTQLIRDRR